MALIDQCLDSLGVEAADSVKYDVSQFESLLIRCQTSEEIPMPKDATPVKRTDECDAVVQDLVDEQVTLDLEGQAHC